jgi:hypothetical protein
LGDAQEWHGADEIFPGLFVGDNQFLPAALKASVFTSICVNGGRAGEWLSSYPSH